MDKFYIGYTTSGRWEVFSASTPKDATPEASGYENVEGPFYTEKEAQEKADANN